jgi:predicted GH43/DUF377 family glycosyl hydrolase
LPVHRLRLRLNRDPGRKIARFFWPGGEERARNIIKRLQALSEKETRSLLKSTLAEFSEGHPDLKGILSEHCDEALLRTGVPADMSEEGRLLIGAYFTMEYAFASAALFNPSMVPAGDQSGVAEGSTRFVMSLRAVGEGHVSSIVFQTGIIDPDGGITLPAPRARARRVRVVRDRPHVKEETKQRLSETGVYPLVMRDVLSRLPDEFSTQQVLGAIASVRGAAGGRADVNAACDHLLLLVESHYRLDAGGPVTTPEEFVIFPFSPRESMGMEDMRLVRFARDDGSFTLYGAYTACNGRQISPQLMAFHGGGVADMVPLTGRYAGHKGHALFPRQIDGTFAMITRIDGENLYLALSDNMLVWDQAVRIREPRYSWEFVQIGNCGSPIETEVGWLLLTHGVGPMRRYCIGAVLLDLNDPSKVIGHLDEPLLAPVADERTGYVPNVVYSCGGMIHGGLLVIPYGISDAATGFATVPMDALLERLLG